MTKEFHSFKPSMVFDGNNMKIYRESDYPVECFGAPIFYTAYLTWKGKEIALGAGNTKEELLYELDYWKENEKVYNLIKEDIKRFQGD
ncbi:MAG: hypothetical protein ACKVE3_06920 [Dissulfuribacterales bacterium]